MGEAILTPQTTSDFLTGNADDLDRMATLTRGLSKRLDHGVGIGALARATAQYNDIHKKSPFFMPQARGIHFVVTKTDGAIQSSAGHISRQCSLDIISPPDNSSTVLTLSPIIEQQIVARKVSTVRKLA